MDSTLIPSQCRPVVTRGAAWVDTLTSSVKLMVLACKWCLLCGCWGRGRALDRDGGGGAGVICRLRPYKSPLNDEHSTYDLWGPQRRPVKTATRKHVAQPPWRRCQFSYLIAYWARSAEFHLLRDLVKSSSSSAAAAAARGESSVSLFIHIVLTLLDNYCTVRMRCSCECRSWAFW